MYVGHKMAIVSDEPGTTRDVSEFEYTDEDTELTYILADSGWLDFGWEASDIKHDITDRTTRAIEESDLILWIIEYDRITDLDEKILDILRKKKMSNVFVIANKADNESQEMEAYSLAWIGWFENFFPVSVSHNRGINTIKQEVLRFLQKNNLEYTKEEYDEEVIKLAIIGRPNVGKSSIINGILGHERVLVRDMQGTTRDSIDTKFVYEGNEYVLIDTAGMRKKGRIFEAVERYSLIRSLKAIDRSDVCLLLLDAKEGIVEQDKHIASYALDAGKSIVIVVNKWDIVEIIFNLCLGQM